MPARTMIVDLYSQNNDRRLVQCSVYMHVPCKSCLWSRNVVKEMAKRRKAQLKEIEEKKCGRGGSIQHSCKLSVRVSQCRYLAALVWQNRLHKLAYHCISQYYMSLSTACSISGWKLQLESSRNIIFTVVIHWAIEDLSRYDLLECIINITLLEDCVNSVNYFDVTEVHASGFTVWLPKHYSQIMHAPAFECFTDKCVSQC